MNQSMRWMAVAALVAGMMIAGGCVSRSAYQEEQAARASAEARLRAARTRIRNLEKTPKATAEEAPKPEVVKPAKPEKPAPKEEARPMGTAREAARALRVGLVLDDGRSGDEPSVLKKALRSRVEGALAAAGFRVAATGPFEVGVTICLRARKVNERGSRVVWNGDADVRVVRASMQNPIQDDVVIDAIARSWTDVTSGEARSTDAAQKKLAEALAEELAPFVAEAANRAGARLRVSTVTVQKAWAPRDAVGYPTKFAAEVLSMPCVYRCEVTSFDKKEQILRAEVVYDTEAYPDGFVNRLQQKRELGFGRVK